MQSGFAARAGTFVPSCFRVIQTGAGFADGATLDPRHHPRHSTCMDEQGSDISQMTFEDALKALEDVVRKLESGEVPLDESIGLYECGEKLRKHCQARLDAAQARIEKIVAGPDGKAAGVEPFDAG